MISSDNFIPLGKIEGGYIVKVFGKKTVALVMAVAMMLSLCCVNVGAAVVKPTAIEIEGAQDTMGVGEVLELSIDATPSNASKSVTWDASPRGIVSVSSSGKVTGKKAGEVTITATSKSAKDVTATVIIEVKDVVEVEAADLTVGYGTSVSTVKAMLNAQEDTKLIYGEGADEYYEDKYTGTWKAPTSFNKGKTYGDFTFEIDDDDLTGSVTVTVGDIDLKNSDDATLDAIYIPTGTKYTTSLLPKEVSLQLNNSTEKTTLTVGSSKTADFVSWDGPILSTKEKFEDPGTYTYTTTLRDEDNWAEIELTQPVVVYDNEVAEIELDAGDSYIYLDDAADYINAALREIFGSDAELHHIDITTITGNNKETDKDGDTYISGTLYTDNECDTEVTESSDAFTAEEFDDLYFVANGKGQYTVLKYTAYADEAGKQALKGEIWIDSETFMILQLEVANSEVLDLSSSDFTSAFKKLDKNYVLDYVVFNNELYSSEGELYYKYSVKKDREVVSDEWFFVKASAKDDEWDLDDVSFVPDEDAEGIVSIEFMACGYDGDDNEVESAGILQINVLDQANIVITAGVEEKVPVDVELFEEYLDDEADTDKIAYIVFDGAPYTTSSGYLVSGTKSFKSSGDKTFHMDPDKGDDEYDLEDLYFVGGSSKGTKRADFEIYYYDGKEVVDDPVTGTVDFVTGVSVNIYTKSPMKASTVLKFSSSIEAFEKVGDQENEYFKFTSLPRDGKLYYNFGLSSQEDVKLNEAYYLGTVTGSKKALKNITFVPSYSSDKQQQVITFDYKAYDKDGNYVAGSCFFEVKYASKSDYFSDITNGVYADSVDFLKNQGITTGVPGGKYDANGSLTRAQVVTFLYRAAGEPAVAGTTTFKDIVKGEYYYNAVLWASQTGVTNGRSATVFDPNATVTNAEVIQFMYNFDVKYLKHSYAAGSTGIVTDYKNVEAWAQTAVKWATGKGVLTAGYLYPASVGTRGNIALYLHRMLTL